MKVDLEAKALDFIRDKGKIVTIDMFTPKSCWVSVSEPKVTFGKPKSLQNFDEYIIDDVSVYIEMTVGCILRTEWT